MESKDQKQDKDHSHLPKRWLGCDVEADFFGDERKHGKQERKLASSKDRSKYKKTDQRKVIKEREFKVDKDLLERGRVLSIASQGILVDAESGDTLYCTLRGVLKKEKTQYKNLVTVGDFVLFERTVAGEGLIAHVEPRHSQLSRSDNLSRRKEQLIAANIDQVIITTSVVLPPLKPSLLDRYIIAAQKGDMEPIIVINKIDLLASNAVGVETEVLEQERELYHELLTAYQGIGIPVISISTVTGEGIEELKEAMAGKASVFSGQSGVGKSSLINTITGQNLRVGDIVEKTQKGSHTTSTAQLLKLEFGGWCIDTPGIKSFGVWDLDIEEVEQGFPEIFTCGHNCRYPDCSHMGEEGCEVVKAVTTGEVSWLRYDSYVALMQSIKENHIRR